jgi:hypothetical protein
MTDPKEEHPMRTPSTYYRLGAAVALGTVLFLAFGITALGIIGPGGRPDLMYAGAVAIGVVGAVLARFRSRGMALALWATAAATMVVAVIAIADGLHHTDGASAIEIVGLSGMYATLFGVSAWLFQRAAEQGSAQRV